MNEKEKKKLLITYGLEDEQDVCSKVSSCNNDKDERENDEDVEEEEGEEALGMGCLARSAPCGLKPSPKMLFFSSMMKTTRRHVRKLVQKK